MTPARSHPDVEELLPWYANGTLTDEERQQVESHLERCEACRADLGMLRELNESAQTVVARMPVPENNLAATMARIDALEPSARGVLARISDFVRVALAPGPARWALAAQLAVILLLVGALVGRPPAQPAYTTLSGGEVDSGGGVRLTLTFQPQATAEAIQQALRDVRATIVSGPSAAGVFIVAMPVEATDAAVDDAIAALRNRGDVVSFVERQP